MNKTIYLVRHGETSHNRDNNKLSGVTDVQMTDNGREQCRRLASFFVSHPIDKVFCSPLTRARESASLIFPDNYATIAPDLIEVNYGTYEGFDRSKITSPDPIIEQWNSTPADMTFPEGDHVTAHGRQAFESLKNLVDSSDFDTIAIVSHRTTIRLLVATIIGLHLNKFRQLPCSNCSLTLLSYGTHFELKTLNLPYNFIV